MQEQFQKHLAAIKYWLARQPNMDVMYVDYNKMIAKPENYCQAIADFIALRWMFQNACRSQSAPLSEPRHQILKSL